MNQQQFKNRIVGLSNVYELLEILNEIVHKETQKENLCFEMAHLYSFANLNNDQSRKFRTFTIPKKSKGKRIVAEPKSYLYLQLLRSIKTMLQMVYRAPRSAHGFIPEKSIVSNAKSHQGKRNIYNTDLKDFFVTISASRVYEALKSKPFCFDKGVAKLIANICCANSELEHIVSPYKNCLPQGSPASPILTNIVCIPLDRALVDFANRYNAHYTRYADDITFSSNNWQIRSRSFNLKLKSLIRSLGFRTNDKKTRSAHEGERLEVTGLVVSKDKVNVNRNYIRELRNLFYIWESYGYEEAEKALRRYYAQDNKHHKGAPSLANVVHGKLMYLKMVKSEQDAVYLKMLERYISLMNISFDKKTSKNSKIDKNKLAEKSYREMLAREEWQNKRKQILKRDRNKCQKCNNDIELNIHHRYYIEDHLPWEYHNSALITLCRDCHCEVHRKKDIPVYDSDPVDNPRATIVQKEQCSRCDGYGIIPRYLRILNGVCFACWGSGYHEFYRHYGAKIKKVVKMKKNLYKSSLRKS